MRYAILCCLFLVMTSCQNEERFVYYPNGKVKAEKTFKDGKLNGLYKEYYEDGQLRYVRYYIDGLVEGKSITYHKNGKLAEVHNYKSNLLNDTCIDFDPIDPLKYINIYSMDSFISQEVVDTIKNIRLISVNYDHAIHYYYNSKVQLIKAGFRFPENNFNLEFDTAGNIINLVNSSNLKMLTKADSLDLDRSYSDWKEQISNWGKSKK